MWHWNISVLIIFEQTAKLILEYFKTQLSAQITCLSFINVYPMMYLYFCLLRLVFPFSRSLFARAPVLHLHLCLTPISLQVCLSVFSHLWSLFSAGGGSSGSGNRSVRCHYSSNSVIRHRALPAHAACYGADTARAVRRLGRDSIWHAQRWARTGGVQGCTRVEIRSWVGWRQRGHQDKGGERKGKIFYTPFHILNTPQGYSYEW